MAEDMAQLAALDFSKPKIASVDPPLPIRAVTWEQFLMDGCYQREALLKMWDMASVRRDKVHIKQRYVNSDAIALTAIAGGRNGGKRLAC